MKDEEKVMIGPLDHFIHPRSGKEGSKLINDLYKDSKIQSEVLSEGITTDRHTRKPLSGIHFKARIGLDYRSEPLRE